MTPTALGGSIADVAAEHNVALDDVKGALSRGAPVIFAMPGMVLATIFVCLPFVIREVIPVLR